MATLGGQGAGQAMLYAQVPGPVGQMTLSDLAGIVGLPGGERGFDELDEVGSLHGGVSWAKSMQETCQPSSDLTNKPRERGSRGLFAIERRPVQAEALTLLLCTRFMALTTANCLVASRFLGSRLTAFSKALTASAYDLILR